VNQHSTDRKRRFTDMMNVDAMQKVEVREINNGNNNNLNNGMIDGPSENSIPTTERRTIQIISYKKKNAIINDADLEKIMNTMNSFGSKDEVRNYLRSKINSILQTENALPCVGAEEKINQAENSENKIKKKN